MKRIRLTESGLHQLIKEMVLNEATYRQKQLIHFCEKMLGVKFDWGMINDWREVQVFLAQYADAAYAEKEKRLAQQTDRVQQKREKMRSYAEEHPYESVVHRIAENVIRKLNEGEDDEPTEKLLETDEETIKFIREKENDEYPWFLEHPNYLTFGEGDIYADERNEKGFLYTPEAKEAGITAKNFDLNNDETLKAYLNAIKRLLMQNTLRAWRGQKSYDDSWEEEKDDAIEEMTEKYMKMWNLDLNDSNLKDFFRTYFYDHYDYDGGFKYNDYDLFREMQDYFQRKVAFGESYVREQVEKKLRKKLNEWHADWSGGPQSPTWRYYVPDSLNDLVEYYVKEKDFDEDKVYNDIIVCLEDILSPEEEERYIEYIYDDETLEDTNHPLSDFQTLMDLTKDTGLSLSDIVKYIDSYISRYTAEEVYSKLTHDLGYDLFETE